MQNVESKKRWCVYAEGFDNTAGLPIMIHQKETAPSIHDVWRDFSFFHSHITFTVISITEVKQNE